MAKVTKILETTLAAGATSAIFNDADIPNSLIRVFATNSNIYPQSVSLSGTTLTVSYEAQTASMGVAIELTKQGLDIIDNLTSSDDAAALSAKQGKALKDAIDAIPEPPENITDLSDVLITDIEDGQVLAWDDVEQKFVNVDQSGGDDGDIYSTDETIIGKWIDNSDIYRKVYKFSTPVSCNTNAWANTDITTSSLNVKQLVKSVTSYDDTCYPCAVSADTNNTYIALLNVRNVAISINTLILEYTKNS